MVGTANADWYVTGDHNVLVSSTDWGTQSENKMHATTMANVYALVVENKSVTSNTKYYVKVTDGSNYYDFDGTANGMTNKTDISFNYSTTYTIVYYFNTETHKIRFIATPMLRWNLGDSGNGNWNWTYEESSMFSRDGDFKWTHEITSDDFTKDTSFRIYSSLWNNMACPASQDMLLSYGGESSTSSQFEYISSTDNSWKITKPAYTFEKAVITAVYNPFANDVYGTWTVSADAYIKKTISSVGYATFGSTANVDFSKASPALTSAQKVKVTSDGKLTLTDATTLAGGEGALLAGSSGDYLVPVVATASADTENNDLVAITTEGYVESTNDIKKYILANVGGNLGFYLVYPSGGSYCGAGSAYLSVPTSYNLSKDFIGFGDDETTGVNMLNVERLTLNENEPMYNLAGQRVANGYKGLVIQNGKKYVK